MRAIDIGAQIRKARLLRGWSQHTLAERSGFRRQHIDKWERGLTRPYFDSLAKVGQTLGVPGNILLRDALKQAGLDVHLNASFTEGIAVSIASGARKPPQSVRRAPARERAA